MVFPSILFTIPIWQSLEPNYVSGRAIMQIMQLKTKPTQYVGSCRNGNGNQDRCSQFILINIVHLDSDVVMTMIHYKRDGICILIHVIIIYILVKHIDLIIGCMIALVPYLLKPGCWMQSETSRQVCMCIHFHSHPPPTITVLQCIALVSTTLGGCS